MDVLVAAKQRQQAAMLIMNELQLMEHWSAIGTPVLVGAASYDLMVSPDIDLEIFCAGEPSIEAGFSVLTACATHPNTTKARFSNLLAAPDEGIYWQLRYQHEGEEWKIDMWTLRHDHPGPLSSWIVEPMRAALTDKTRRTILTLKNALAERPDLRCGSIHIYRAVLDDGVTTLDEFLHRKAVHDTASLTSWVPEASESGKD